ncbi:MAG: hypothetical protein AAFY71_15070 [Bacteroidota bacterium]
MSKICFAILFGLISYLLGPTRGNILSAQQTNAAILQKLWQQEVSNLSDSLKAIEADFPLAEWLNASLDSSSTMSIKASLPVVSYLRLQKGAFERTIFQSYEAKGKVNQIHSISYKDTLDKPSLMRIRKAGPDYLKGDDPRLWSKLTKPAIWIVGTTGTIFSLFYVRSRQQ